MIERCLKICHLKMIIFVALTYLIAGCSLDFSFHVVDSETIKISSVSPSILNVSGGEILQVKGSGFLPGDRVLLGNKSCLNIDVQSSTSIICTAPASTSVAAINVKVIRGEQTTIASQKMMVSLILGGAASGGLEMFQKNLATPWSVKQIAGKVYIANSAQYKISILNSLPIRSYPAFDSVLGQKSLDEIQMTGFKENQKYSFAAFDFDSDGNHFVVADSNQHRILIWNSIPTSATQPADVVVGHADFLGKEANDGGVVSASSLNGPRGIKISGGKLIVADSGNNRVLIWNSIPTSNIGADVVLGQVDFNSNTKNAGGTSASSLNAPYHIEVAGSKLLVADTSNNRVLIWDNIPSVNQVPADVVLGQALFTTATVNNGGLSAKSLRAPSGIYYDGTRLFVADTSNNRVLIWSTLPTVNFTLANVVVGQTLFTTATAGTTDSNLSSPARMQVIENQLVVSDSGNHRVLIYPDVPISSGEVAAYVVGQPSMTDSLSRNPNKPLGMANVTGVSTDGVRLAVADTGKNRILIWNSMPTSSDQVPDIILGQADLNGYLKAASVSASSLSGPRSVLIVQNKLYVADSGNNRILIWNSWPTANNQAADVVLGQTLMTTNTSNLGGISATSISNPFGLSTDGTRLLLSDIGNNRTLIWNTIPTANGTPADVVIGQPDMISGVANNGGLSASSLSGPYQARIFNGKLFIADKANLRVLIYNSVPSTNGAAADIVIGQSNMTESLFYPIVGDSNAGTLKAPMDMYVDGDKLYVLEDVANRIVVFDSLVNFNGALGHSAIGMSTLTSLASAQPKGFGWPNSLNVTADNIVVADYINGRVLILPKQ